MIIRRIAFGILLASILSVPRTVVAQTSPVWTQEKIPNFLPHMTVPEVRDLLTRSDMVIIPVTSLEQHGLHLPIGTDYYGGVERAKLIAQRTDVLVAPILFPGQSPYHMGFEGTITLSAETIQSVIFEAAQSLMQHGFKRFLILNAHGGNRAITGFIVDRINQETDASPWTWAPRRHPSPIAIGWPRSPAQRSWTVTGVCPRPPGPCTWRPPW